MIIQSQRTRLINGITTRDIACTIAQADAFEAKQILEAASLECGDIIVDEAIAKVSIVGSGMIGQPGIASKMFQALAVAGINIQMITTSEIRVSCLVPQAQGVIALQTIHQAFELGGQQTIAVPG
jgi:aspartate kinase